MNPNEAGMSRGCNIAAGALTLVFRPTVTASDGHSHLARQLLDWCLLNGRAPLTCARSAPPAFVPRSTGARAAIRCFTYTHNRKTATHPGVHASPPFKEHTAGTALQTSCRLTMAIRSGPPPPPPPPLRCAPPAARPSTFIPSLFSEDQVFSLGRKGSSTKDPKTYSFA